MPQTNNYHPYSQTQATPLKNYYEEDYDHRHRENTIKGPESNTNARKKWPTQSQSPVPNKMANMNKENPRFDVMRPKSPISVSNNPRKISDNKSPLMQKTLHRYLFKIDTRDL